MIARALLLIAVSLGLGACASTPRHPERPPVDPVVAANAAADAAWQRNPGGIYNPQTGYALFEDPKARAAGDLLTVLLVERTQAQKSAATSTSKEGNTEIGNPTLFGRPLTRGGAEVGAFGLESSRGFDGKGDSSQSNRLSGSITVQVVERLPNGNLVVSGEKNLELNQGSERVRLSGIVRAVDVRPDNTVTSDRVADARIQYVGRGALADANAQGWLSRFFNSPWFPF